MLNKKISLFLGTVLIFFPVIVLASDRGRATDAPGPSPAKNISREQKNKINAETRKLHQEFKNDIFETKEQAEEKSEEIKKEKQEFPDSLEKSMEEKKQEFRAKILENKQKLEERITQKREELKRSLEKIKDENKKRTVERIDQNMDNLNKRLLDHYSSVLDKLQSVLTIIGTRTDELQSRGADVSIPRQTIDKASDNINTARAAIVAQSSKTYTLRIGLENKLKTDIGIARKQLHDDLNKIKETVKAAHSSVKNAADSLTGLAGIVSDSPKPNPGDLPILTVSPEVPESQR